MFEFTVSDVYACIALPSFAFEKSFNSARTTRRAYLNLTSSESFLERFQQADQ